MAPSRADAEGFRRIKRRARGQHRRQADQRMERRHQLRHVGHGDAPRHHRADAAADGKAARQSGPRSSGSETPATHRVVRMAISMPIMPLRLPARDGGGRRQALQRQDEQHAGDEIEKGCDIRLPAHLECPAAALLEGVSLSSCTSPACAR